MYMDVCTCTCMLEFACFDALVEVLWLLYIDDLVAAELAQLVRVSPRP